MLDRGREGEGGRVSSYGARVRQQQRVSCVCTAYETKLNTIISQLEERSS